MWTPTEIDYAGDRKEWYKLATDIKTYIVNILALFAQLDGLVNENLISNFKQETRDLAKECGSFYAYQEAIEVTHNETYSNLIKSFVGDPEEQKRCLNSILYYPAVKRIAEWSVSYMDRSLSLLERIVAFACLEGIVFSSAFAGIYWIKRKNILHGLTQANSWIARDEALHTRFAVSLYHHMTKRWGKAEPLAKDRLHAIVKSAVEVNEEFTRTAMKLDLVGLSADSLVQYVKRMADNLCEMLGYDHIYGVPSPFDWMVTISLPNKTNFFESKVSEYALAPKVEDDIFDLNTPF
jgi:ribonucleotide reductase beta subunit family protein with ferritin-like domain